MNHKTLIDFHPRLERARLSVVNHNSPIVSHVVAMARRYPPSCVRYNEKHPVVSVRLTDDLKKLLDAFRASRDNMSYGEAVKALLAECRDAMRLEAKNRRLEAGARELEGESGRLVGELKECRRAAEELSTLKAKVVEARDEILRQLIKKGLMDELVRRLAHGSP